MKVQFYLKRKVIQCYVREYNDTLSLNTKQNIEPSYWDKKTHRADPRKTKDPVIKGSLKKLNVYLNEFENKIYDTERSIRGKRPDAVFGVIKEAIQKQFNKKETSDLFDIFDEFLKIKALQISKQSLYKLKRVKSLLEEYQKEKNERLDFEKFNPIFFSKFYSFLVEQKDMINNSAHKNVQFLKTFLIWANANEYHNNTSFRTYKGKYEANEVIYLTLDELMKLNDMVFQKDEEKLERVRDIFVFQCFTGVRYSDILNISWDDFQGTTWRIRTQKTRQILELPLNPYAYSIIQKYSGFPKPLPVISNQKMNLYLKELCEKAEINEQVRIYQYQGSKRIELSRKKYEVIGTHTARRTFVTVSLEKNIKPEVIMALTGHSDIRMMHRYLKIADKHKRDEIEKAWGTHLRKVE